MHSYLHNIKTFNNATRHLTRVERALYRDAIELYYDTEQPLPAVDFDRLARRLMANTEDEVAALEYVLGEFFERTGDVYTHHYCDEVIEAYHTSTTAKSIAGKASAAARKKKAEERRAARKAQKEQKATGVEQTLNTPSTAVANHEPETINHTKDNGAGKPAPFRAAKIDLPPEVDPGIWAEWCSYRTSRKKPISEAGATKQIELLAQHPRSVQREIITTSITNDYQGLFPPKGGGRQLAVVGSSRGSSLAEDLTDTSWAD